MRGEARAAAVTDTTVLNMDIPGPRPGPALSATSDMPTIAKEAPAAETAEPAATAKPAGNEAVETTAEAVGTATEAVETTEKTTTAETAATETTEVKPKKPISERFSEITAQRKAAEDRANRAQDALNDAIATIKQLSGKDSEAEAKRVEA